MVVTIVLDNGASTIKVGIVNKDEQPRLEIYLIYLRRPESFLNVSFQKKK